MIYDYAVEKISNEKSGSEFYIAMSRSLRGCVGQGVTTEEAIAELEENERVWLDTAIEYGIPIPAVPER